MEGGFSQCTQSSVQIGEPLGFIDVAWCVLCKGIGEKDLTQDDDG
jgi:hypothetical protein